MCSRFRGILGIGLRTYTNYSVVRSIKMAASRPHHCDDIVWMDLEMTGLDVANDKILEISCLITDKDLNVKSEGPSLVIHQPASVLDNMGEWCVEHHTASGLVEQCLNSRITTAQAEQMVLEYLEENVPKNKCPLAGNSIYMDRLFLRLYMPKVDEYLHYRVIDVSTIKELASRWNPHILKCAPRKTCQHRTLDDIRESIKECQYYRQSFFNIHQ